MGLVFLLRSEDFVSVGMEDGITDRTLKLPTQTDTHYVIKRPEDSGLEIFWMEEKENLEFMV